MENWKYLNVFGKLEIFKYIWKIEKIFGNLEIFLENGKLFENWIDFWKINGQNQNFRQKQKFGQNLNFSQTQNLNSRC